MSRPIPRESSVETLLVEVESAAADILMRPDRGASVDDNGVARWAAECVIEMRDALLKDDAGTAAYIGYRLGERLAELRLVAERVRRDGALKMLISRSQQEAD